MDPVTHNIVVVADKETIAQMQRVLDKLDAPEPQVLIKVVFLEVDDSKALDLGLQGNYNGASKLWADFELYNQLQSYPRHCYNGYKRW